MSLDDVEIDRARHREGGRQCRDDAGELQENRPRGVERWPSCLEIRANLPELPEGRKQRLMAEYGFSEYDAAVITASKAMADYLDQSVEHKADAKLVANWLMGEVSKHLNNESISIKECPVAPNN